MEQLSLNSTAEEVELSSSHFSRMFKKTTGRTFLEYLMDVRIKKACELLRDTDRSITNVAFDVGFNDSSYFGKVFRKHTRMSPSKYRAKHNA